MYFGLVENFIKQKIILNCTGALLKKTIKERLKNLILENSPSKLEQVLILSSDNTFIPVESPFL